jgi:D-alanyl-D-alanine carboxypeptidase
MKLNVPCLLFGACVGCGAPGLAAPCPAQPVAPSAAQPTSSVVGQLAVPAPSAAPPATFDVAAIDKYIARQMSRQGFIGLSVAIVKDGAIVLDKGYGRSQIEPDAPMRSDTALSIGSISKQFISTLILLLANEKKLSLDDRVAKYYPALTRANDITLYDLMTHVSGYRDYFPLDFIDQEMKQPAIQDDVIARYGKRPLDFEPRTRFSYSSTGYKILARVIEKVTGKPLGTVLSERILRPVGMSHSSYMPTADAPGVARGYTSFALGPPEPAEFEGKDWGFGAGGIFAPAGDIARWDIALMSGKVLGPEDYKTLTTARRLADGRVTTYGCGIGTTVTKSGERLLRHSGQSPGFVAYSVLLPRTRSAVVALSNRDDAPPWDLVNDLVALISEEHRAVPPKIAGPSAREVAKHIFAQLQSGHVDRDGLGDDFNTFLADAKLRAASERLRALGEPSAVDVEDTQERGGMEETTVRFTFPTRAVEATMFRSVDGKVQQFLIEKL